MAKGEIVILEQLCKGCGLCTELCPTDCIAIRGDKFSGWGYPLPVVVRSEDCTGCAICGTMCPEFAIEVYKYSDEAATKEKGSPGETGS